MPTIMPTRAGARLIAVLCLALCIRLVWLDYSVWFDELSSLFFADQPLIDLLGRWTIRETNPPAFYIMLKGWIAVVGYHAWALRLLPIAGGLCTIWVLQDAARRTFGNREAVIITLALALSAQSLFFSHLLRSYAFLYLAIAISLHGLLRIVEDGDVGRRSVGAWATFAIGAGASVYFHTSAILWMVAATIALCSVRLAERRLTWRFLGELFLACLVWLAIAVPWLVAVTLQLRGGGGNIAWISWGGWAYTLQLFLQTLLLTREAYGWQILIPLSALGLALHGAWVGRRRSSVRLLTVLPVVALALFLAASPFQPMIMERTIYWISFMPALLIAHGMAMLPAIWRREFAAGFFVALAFNCGTQIHRLPQEDWVTVVHRASETPRSVVIVDGEAMRIALRFACRLQGSEPDCPFRVVALVDRGKHTDAWADGYGDYGPKLSPTPVTQLFVFSRFMHDALSDLQKQGALKGVAHDGDLQGPFPIDSVGAPLANAIRAHRLLHLPRD